MEKAIEREIANVRYSVCFSGNPIGDPEINRGLNSSDLQGTDTRRYRDRTNTVDGRMDNYSRGGAGDCIKGYSRRLCVNRKIFMLTYACQSSPANNPPA